MENIISYLDILFLFIYSHFFKKININFYLDLTTSLIAFVIILEQIFVVLIVHDVVLMF